MNVIKIQFSRQSLSKKVLACKLIQFFVQFYFHYILNVPTMMDFRQKESQEILHVMLFLFFDC